MRETWRERLAQWWCARVGHKPDGNGFCDRCLILLPKEKP